MKSPLYTDSQIETATRKAYNFLDAQPDHGVEFLRKNIRLPLMRQHLL